MADDISTFENGVTTPQPEFGTPFEAETSSPARLPVFRLKPHLVIADRTSDPYRLAPYVTRGRDHETACIARAIQAAPCSIHLVTGAPGSGKSSILANAKQLAKAWGCQVMSLSATDFSGDIALANAIRREAGGELPQPRSRDITETEHLSAAVAGTGPAATSSETQHHDEDEPNAWRDAILAIAARQPDRPTVIFLDEVQRLEEKTVGDREMWNRVESFLQTMHTELLDLPAEVRPRTMLVCAGLLNAPDVLAGYRVSRIENIGIIRLGPLSDGAAREILQDFITARTRTGASLPPLPEALTLELIESSGSNAHHLTVAGLAAQKVASQALKNGQAELNQEQCQAIIQEARLGRIGLYKLRVGLGKGDPADDATSALAQATETWGMQLPQKSTMRLVRAVGEAQSKPNLLSDMTRQGIIELRTEADRFPTAAVGNDDRSHYVFAIHSTSAWINEQRQKSPTHTRRRDTEANQALIAEHFGTPESDDTIPAWRWDYSRPLEELCPMPDDKIVQNLNDIAEGHVKVSQ